MIWHYKHTIQNWNEIRMIFCGIGMINSASLHAESCTPSDCKFEVQSSNQHLVSKQSSQTGRLEPGFKFRGIKGWGWSPNQYLEEIPILTRYKMNFLMNCYLSLFVVEKSGSYRNEWWKPLPSTIKEAYGRIIRACQTNGINFCFSVHPQLKSPRPLTPENARDIEDYFQHFAWAQSEGVHWFSISLDDVNWGKKGPASGGLAHARLVNIIFERLRQKDPGAQMIFCPVSYWGDGTQPDQRAYLESLALTLHPEVYIFWTGDKETTPRITLRAAKSYKKIVKHRLFLWDNYPVNDGYPTLHLGPLVGRDVDLCSVIDGYMSNSMATQNQINRLPLATCADYAYNPWNYDPQRSIEQAIFQLAEPTTGNSALAPAKLKSRRQVLKEMVDAYPGFIRTGGHTATNPVRDTFNHLLTRKDSPNAAKEYCAKIEGLSARLAKEFPQQFLAGQKTVVDDVVWMKSRL